METEASQEARNTTQNSSAKQGNGKTPKLRASCDHCSNAKVRCGQDRPSCQRCLYLNIPCNYSASRRKGRTSKSGRAANAKAKVKTTTGRNSKAESDCSDSTSESSGSPKNNTQQMPDIDLGSYGQDFDFTASQPWNDANFMADLSGSPDFASFSDPQANASHLTQPQLDTTQLQNILPSSDQLGFTTPFQNNTNQSSNCIRAGAGQSAFQQISPDLLTSSDTFMDQGGSINHQSTSCMELASSTILSLSLPSSMCTSSPDPTPLHTVEQVLATSRGAVSAFNTILQCPCSHSNSFTLTLALMISKILDCYSAICRCSTSSGNLLPTTPPPCITGSNRNPPSSRDLPTPSSSSTSLAALSPTVSTSTSLPRGAAHNIVLDTPIAIGGFKIDPDDEYVFILQLVLSELRKVGKLVDAFAVQYSTANQKTSDFVSAANKAIINGRPSFGEDSVCQSLEQFLRCQVHKAKVEVDAVLRRSEEGG